MPQENLVAFTPACIPNGQVVQKGGGSAIFEYAGTGGECCSLLFFVNMDSSDLVPDTTCPAKPEGEGYPQSDVTTKNNFNKCFGTPIITSSGVDFDRAIIDTQWYVSSSESLFVDDDLLISIGGAQATRFQGGMYTGSFNRSLNQDCVFGQPIPVTSCNVQHDISAGTLLATVPEGERWAFRAIDNHGGALKLSGYIEARPTSAP
tara:strand:- start:500 stop:1114 length:615 start_codon:yes stop_codon:yes gene_type:complete